MLSFMTSQRRHNPAKPTKQHVILCARPTNSECTRNRRSRNSARKIGINSDCTEKRKFSCAAKSRSENPPIATYVRSSKRQAKWRPER